MTIQEPPTQPRPVESQNLPVNLKKPNRIGIGVLIAMVTIILIGGGVFGWYYFYGPCGVSRVEKASTELLDILSRFDDGNNVANSTARISLAGPVTNLQQIARDLNGVEVPICLDNSKQQLANGMDSIITGYLKFMQDKPDAEVNASIISGTQYLMSTKTWITDIRKCAPFCTGK